jgi:hypothetical protein
MLDSAYKEFENDAGRAIQEPIAQLKAVHKRIGTLLSRIELPPICIPVGKSIQR